MIILIILQTIAIGGLILYIHKRDEKITSITEHKLHTSEKFLRTVAGGIAQRFSHDSTSDLPTSFFLVQTKEEFYSFAAHIIQRIDGGSVYLTYHSTYAYPHFEIERADGSYIGIALAKRTEVPYETIAILHSHIIHQQAQGGYVVTTSTFTPEAYVYAKKLDIQLINGVQLATLWMEAMDHTRYEEKQPFRSDRHL